MWVFQSQIKLGSIIVICVMLAACGSDSGNGNGNGNGNGTTSTPQSDNFVFVTSTRQDGNLGGLSGADAICNRQAATAGLPGNYVAWLSTNTVNASDRLSIARGWVRPDGQPFADTVNDIILGKILYPPRLDEFGIEIDIPDEVITGTNSNGTANENCSNWTNGVSATGGFASFTTQGWTALFTADCSTPMRLYCFGTDHVKEISTPQSTGRLAFVSKSSFPADSGLTAADTLCGNEAAVAALPGTYKALLATESFTAVSRFNLTGSTWSRLDGVHVVSQPSDLAGTQQLLAPINLQADGTTYEGITGIWTGATDFKTVATGTSCNNWTSINGDGAIRWSSNSDDFSGTRTLCNNSDIRVFCLQE